MKKQMFGDKPEITVENYRKIVEDADRNVYWTRYEADLNKLEHYMMKADTTKAKICTLIGRNSGHLHALFGNRNKKPSLIGSNLLEDVVEALNRMLPGENLKAEDFVIREVPSSTPYESRRRRAIIDHLKKAGFVNPDGSVMTEKDVIRYKNTATTDSAVKRDEETEAGETGILPDTEKETLPESRPVNPEESGSAEVTNPQICNGEQNEEQKNGGIYRVSDNSREIVPALRNLLEAVGLTLEEYVERNGFTETEKDITLRFNMITNRHIDVLRKKLQS